MKVWGLTEHYKIEVIARNFDMKLSNVRMEGRAIAFKLDCTSSKSRYARRTSYRSEKTGLGRALTALCYHGWRDFTRALFEHGATRVQTMQGNWITRDAFDNDLYRLASVEIGSMMYPCRFIEACDDNGHDTSYLEWIVPLPGKNALGEEIPEGYTESQHNLEWHKAQETRIDA